MVKETTFNDFLEDDEREPPRQSAVLRNRYYSAGETKPWLGKRDMDNQEHLKYTSPSFQPVASPSSKHMPSPYDALGGGHAIRTSLTPRSVNGSRFKEAETTFSTIENVSTVNGSSAPRAQTTTNAQTFDGTRHRHHTKDRLTKQYSHPSKGPSANYAYNYGSHPIDAQTAEQRTELAESVTDFGYNEASSWKSLAQVSAPAYQNNMAASDAIRRITRKVSGDKSAPNNDLNVTPSIIKQSIVHSSKVNKSNHLTVADKAPFAPHYADSRVSYTSFQPTEAAELMDRYGYHYEGLGDLPRKRAEDTKLAAERARKEREYELQLFKQMDDKKRIAAREKDNQLQLEGATIASIVEIGNHDELRKQRTRETRRKLEAEWLEAAAEKKERDEAMRKSLVPWEENWNILEAQARSTELRNLSEAERQRREEQLRLENWKSAQERKAEELRAIEEERRRIEELTLSPNVANFAERILLAEEQKRKDQHRYKQQLDEQIRAKHLKNKTLAAEQFELECRLGSF